MARIPQAGADLVVALLARVILGWLLQVLMETKELLRSVMRSELDLANQRECDALQRIWSSSEGVNSLISYLRKQDKVLP